MNTKQMKDLTPLEFIAQMLNEQKTKEVGYSMPTRWLTLNEDLKEEYLAKALEIFEAWKFNELNAEKNRNDLMKGVKIKKH